MLDKKKPFSDNREAIGAPLQKEKKKLTQKKRKMEAQLVLLYFGSELSCNMNYFLK
jgi:hypothetical protein